MKLTNAILNEIKAHAAQCAPRECCGVIVELSNGWGYWPCENVSNIDGQFEINALDYVQAADAGTIKMIVHSHINRNAAPTHADLTECETSGLPWLIVSHPSGEVATFAPRGYQLPLLGRQFAWGICDCFTLLRDHFLQQLGIDIPRPPEGYEPKFWKKGQDFYSRFKEWGFVELPQDDELQTHDVILMRIRSDGIPNHAGIYLGNGVMLHHLEERLSEQVQYGGFWQDATVFRVRHKSLC